MRLQANSGVFTRRGLLARGGRFGLWTGV